MPTLILHGTADRILSIDGQGRRLHAALPDARYVEIEAARTSVRVTHAEEVNRELLAFLREPARGHRRRVARHTDATMLEAFAEHAVETPRGTVGVRVGGDGPALLLLHGYPQTHLMWHAACRRWPSASPSSPPTSRDTAPPSGRRRRRTTLRTEARPGPRPRRGDGRARPRALRGLRRARPRRPRRSNTYERSKKKKKKKPYRCRQCGCSFLTVLLRRRSGSRSLPRSRRGGVSEWERRRAACHSRVSLGRRTGSDSFAAPWARAADAFCRVAVVTERPASASSRPGAATAASRGT